MKDGSLPRLDPVQIISLSFDFERAFFRTVLGEECVDLDENNQTYLGRRYILTVVQFSAGP